MKLKDTIKEALIPAFITLAIFAGVLLAKGIFPFGDLRIDYYDMGQTNAPLYYHIWDFLHGKGGLFYSWYIDEGQNLSMGSSIQWNISIFNLFFLFVSRSAVMKSLSIFTGLRLFFMAFNMNLLLRQTIDTPKFYRILFSMAYGLTGFTLTHYTITTYLDTAALMPLYLIALNGILTDKVPGELYASGKKWGIAEAYINKMAFDAGLGDGDKKGEGKGNNSETDDKDGKLKISHISPLTIYALMTGYMTALGYYMAFMNLIFVLLVSGTYIFVLCGVDKADKVECRAERGRAATWLGIGTLAGLGLSAFILLPAAMQMMNSSRFNSNLSGGLYETLHDILWAIGADMYYIKWWLLSGSIAAIVIILYGMVRYRKERRQTIFFFLFCMYPCVLIVFESINLLWHMGTYYHYPIRCGYLIPIVLLVTAAYYTGRAEREFMDRLVNVMAVEETGTAVKGFLRRTRNKNSKPGMISYINFTPINMMMAGIGAMISVVALVLFYMHHEVWGIEVLFRTWVVFAVCLCVIYALIYCVIRKPAYMMPVLLAELAITAYVGYGQPHFVDKYSSDPEQSGEYVVTAQKLADELGVEESRTERIKNPDTTLNTNYGFVMRRATIGGWANTVPREQMDSAIALGYGAHFMRILDCGGTLLSDAMLHVTETLTLEPTLYATEAYEVMGEADGYTLLQNKYTLPFVMTVWDERMSPKITEYRISQMGIVEATNTVYRWLLQGTELENSGNGKDIENMSTEASNEIFDAESIMADITEEVGNGEYYVNSTQALYLREGEFGEIRINGSVIPVPDIGDPDGTAYPAWFNSSLLYLGIYEDEAVKIEGAGSEDTRFYAFDVDKLDALCKLYNKQDVEYSTGRSSLDITMEGKAGQAALIPMAYDEGFTARVNGQKADIINAGNLFMEIPLVDGVNHIRLSFTPKGLVPGVIISFLSLALVIIFTIRPIKVRVLDKISTPILAVLWGTFLIVLYLIPYIAFVVHQIQKRIF